MKFSLLPLFVVLFFLNNAFAGDGLLDGVVETAKHVKRQVVGTELVSVKDPRVIALIATGVITVAFGGLVVAGALSTSEEAEKAGFFKKTFAFLAGDLFIVAGILEVLFARAIITGVDELSFHLLQEINKVK